MHYTKGYSRNTTVEQRTCICQQRRVKLLLNRRPLHGGADEHNLLQANRGNTALKPSSALTFAHPMKRQKHVPADRQPSRPRNQSTSTNSKSATGSCPLRTSSCFSVRTCRRSPYSPSRSKSARMTPRCASCAGQSPSGTAAHLIRSGQDDRRGMAQQGAWPRRSCRGAQKHSAPLARLPYRLKKYRQKCSPLALVPDLKVLPSVAPVEGGGVGVGDPHEPLGAQHRLDG